MIRIAAGRQDYRRVFAHPHIFLITRGLVDPAQTLQLASLSAEPRSCVLVGKHLLIPEHLLYIATIPVRVVFAAMPARRAAIQKNYSCIEILY